MCSATGFSSIPQLYPRRLNLKSPEKPSHDFVVDESAMSNVQEGSNENEVNENEVTKKRRKRRYKKMYCGGCWRVEKHYAINRDWMTIVLFSLLTFGFYFLFRRYKCRICGRQRIAAGE